MKRELSLLERIARIDEVSRSRHQATAEEDIDAVMESVRGHLAQLLNARHGMCEALPDYGIPALSDLLMGSGDHARLMQDAIRLTVEQHEPRLRRVRVTQITDDEETAEKRKIAFRIDAVLVADSGEHRVWYQTEVTGTGEFDVSD